MAIVNRNPSTWMLSLQILFISIGVVSLAVVLSHCFPAMLEFATREVPGIWKSLTSWVTPLYLYVVINGIIITIVASSRFQQREEEQPEVVPPAMAAADLGPQGMKPAFGTTELPEVYLESEDAVPASSPLLHSFESKPVIVATNLVPPPLSDLESPALDSHSKATVPTEVEEDEFVISKSAWTPLARSDSMEIPMEFISPIEKPPVSARFGHRKSVRAGSEGGKPLRGIAKPKRNETLENTWKMITEGRSIPLTRHLRKSDTWEHHNRLNDPGHNPDDPNPDLQRHVKKSDTFKDRTNNLPPAISPSPSPSIRLRKEPSLSQDELNRRVEAFIKKFNEEMRLQRQESLNQYYEMIKHGAH